MNRLTTGPTTAHNGVGCVIGVPLTGMLHNKVQDVVEWGMTGTSPCYEARESSVIVVIFEKHYHAVFLHLVELLGKYAHGLTQSMY